MDTDAAAPRAAVASCETTVKTVPKPETAIEVADPGAASVSISF